MRLGMNWVTRTKWGWLMVTSGLLATGACSEGPGRGPSTDAPGEGAMGTIHSALTGPIGTPPAIVPPTYGGGAIVSPEIVTLYWGSVSGGSKTTMQRYLGNLATYMSGSTAPSKFEPVTYQYGVRGASVGATYSDTSLPSHNGVAGHATTADLATEIANLQAAGHLPAYGPERLIMVFTDGITFDDGYGTSWCGKHFAAASGQYYSVVPLPSVSACGSGGFGGFDVTGVWQGITSHEVLESATDPAALNPAAGPAGWTPEIGGACSWGSNLFDTLDFGVVQAVVDRQTSTCALFAKQTNSQISAVSPGNGPIDVFARGEVSNIIHRHYNPATQTWSSGWENLGETITSAPVALANGLFGGALDVFAQGTDNAYFRKHYTGTSFTHEALPGKFVGPPAVVATSATRVDLFGMGTDGAYYQLTLTPSGWSPLTLIGGVFNGPPAAASAAAGDFRLFGRGTDGAYYTKHWSNGAFTPAGPTAWDRVGTGVYVGDPVVTVTQGVEVFGQGTDFAYYRTVQQGPAWSAPQRIAGAFASPPAVVSQNFLGVDVVGLGTDQIVYHTQISGSSQTPLEALSGLGLGGAAFVRPVVGPVALFIEGTDRTVYEKTLSGTAFTPPNDWTQLNGALH